jgi:hypothetical protein
MRYPFPRPIGEILAQFPDAGEEKMLSGAQINDEDDAEMTMSSLAQAEKLTGNKMAVPVSSAQIFRKSGNRIQDPMAEDHVVSSFTMNQILNEDEVNQQREIAAQVAKKSEKVIKQETH